MIINTGGTLSSVAKEYGLTPGLTTESMLRELHIVAGEAILTTLEYASVDSANIFPEDWAKLAQLISEKRDRFDGIVVIHGTAVRYLYGADRMSRSVRGLQQESHARMPRVKGEVAEF